MRHQPYTDRLVIAHLYLRYRAARYQFTIARNTIAPVREPRERAATEAWNALQSTKIVLQGAALVYPPRAGKKLLNNLIRAAAKRAPATR